MSIIGSATAIHLAPPPKSGSNASSTLATDQAAAKSATAIATQAATHLAADQKAKADAQAIQADQLAIKTAGVAVDKANAQVQADEYFGVNVAA
jgi:hypothetical protein